MLMLMSADCNTCRAQLVTRMSQIAKPVWAHFLAQFGVQNAAQIPGRVLVPKCAPPNVRWHTFWYQKLFHFRVPNVVPLPGFGSVVQFLGPSLGSEMWPTTWAQNLDHLGNESHSTPQPLIRLKNSNSFKK